MKNSKKRKITLERYFYPVGQGLCCRERFIFNDEIDETTGKPKEFNLVYDCGGSSYNFAKCFDIQQKNRSSRFPYPCISSFIANKLKGLKIDILCISHLHDDHINLLQDLKKFRCQTMHIVLPYISKTDLFWNLLDPKIENNETSMRLLGLASGFLQSESDTRVYRLLPKGIKKDSNEKEIKNKYVIESGTDLLNKFGYFDVSNFWQYPHYNYHINLSELDKIYRHLIDNIAPKVFTDLGAFIECRDNIQKEYSRIHPTRGGLLIEDNPRGRYFNEQSTVLFSIPKKKISPTISFDEIKRDITHSTEICYGCNFSLKYYKVPLIHNIKQPGCIYLGDYLAANSSFYHNLKQEIDIYKEKIYTIQMPHHGSKNGLFTDGFYKDRVCVIPYGLRNGYSHPHKIVQETIKEDQGIRVNVTEEAGYVQHFEFTV